MEALRKQKISSRFRGKMKLREFDRIGKDRVIDFPNQQFIFLRNLQLKLPKEY
jgi:hypothetical protein